MADNKVQFRPIQGSEEAILSNPAFRDGTVYYATDSGKTYLDDPISKKRILMGGNASVFYGNMTINYDIVDSNQTEFEFKASEIESPLVASSGGGEIAFNPILPNLGDLILNKDGCFYRVTEIDDMDPDYITLKATRLTLQGTGGSGPSGPGGDVEGVGKIEYSWITPTTASALYQHPFTIDFDFKSYDADGELTSGYYALYLISGDKKTQIPAAGVTFPIDMRKTNHIDVSQYLVAPGVTYRIRVEAFGDIGASDMDVRTKTFNITPTQINLSWTANRIDEANNSKESYTLEWEISGGTGIEKKTHIIINGQDVPEIENGVTEFTFDPSTYGMTHGAYPIEMYVTAPTVNLETEHIRKNIIFAEPDNNAYIISINYFNDPTKQYDMTQYDTVNIPVAIYSTGNVAGTAEVVLKSNGEKVDTWTGVKNLAYKDWIYTPTTDGDHRLEVTCNKQSKIITLRVEKLNINNSEVSGYAFKFKANEFASNDAVKAWKSNDVTASFSPKFDWINGGLTPKPDLDENGNPRQYFCIKAGSRMNINYDLFGTNNLVGRTGKALKIIFKATSCRDYDAQVLSCAGTEGVSERGLILKAQNGVFKSASSSISSPYCEDSYIELEIDIDTVLREDAKNPGRNYIMAWLDGVPAAIVKYDTGDAFHTSATKTIEIGSDDCDVYIYLIKAYNKHLSDEQHLQNFIADAPNALEMLDRYKRNDILDERDEISPVKLALANPDCRVHIYDVDHVSTNKDTDKVKDCKYEQYHNSEVPIVKAEGVTTRVQGTSSASYGLAAFNIDADFKKTTICDGNGEPLTYEWDTEGKYTGKYALNENSIPCNYFTNKVNVASSENANNALNQEWYNRFQPYQSIVKCMNPKARDTMEFTPGVLFLIDRNKQWTPDKDIVKNNVFGETPGYIQNPYAKLYAICNMGNSKKNTEVFHAPHEICMEVSDNQAPQQWMVDDSFVDENIDPPDGSGEKEYYSFRFPDGREDALKEDAEAVNKWRRFVSWMAHSNPQPMYEEIKFEDKYYEMSFTEEEFTETLKDTLLDETKKTIYIYQDEDYVDIKDIFEEEFAELEITEETEASTLADFYDDEEVYYQFMSAAEAFEALKNKTYVWDDPVAKITHIPATTYSATQTYWLKTENVYGYTDEPLPVNDEEGNPLPKNAQGYIEKYLFEPYTFKGYKSDETLQADYDPVVKGYTISTYSTTKKIEHLKTDAQGNPVFDADGKVIVERVETQIVPYTRDTYEYRMAKMLSECEDYLCMDSVVYHYLFIERHCMIDNVAKNTFWSTEDGLVWNLTKDYDNDTADGVDNNGKLTRSYGMEAMDKLNENEYVFNARQSVWFNFIAGLPGLCQHMYQALDSLGAWSAKDYLETFDRWQKAIPERCWIEAYRRLYIRPYDQYGDDTYFEMLNGGRKTHQRKQYETYESYYDASKYFGTDSSSYSILIRGNKQSGALGTALPVKMYSDCYVNAAIGSGQTPNFTKRCKRGETVDVICPFNVLNNTTYYLFSSQLYQEIGSTANKDYNLSNITPAQLSVAKAPKLRTLVLGLENSEANKSLTSVSFENNDLLENLYVANCPEVTGGLDLTNAPSLKHLDARKSGFGSIIIANNAPVEEIYLEKPTSITLKNLTELNTLDIKHFSSLGQIIVDNIDKSNINSKTDLFDKTEDGVFTAYSFRNIDWTLTNPDDMNSDFTIDPLEELLSITTAEENGEIPPDSVSLTGTLTIPSSVYSGDNTIDYYNTYATPDKYPSLDIVFEGGKALYNVNIVDGNGRTIWKKKSPAGSIDESFLQSGPNGAFDIDSVYQDATDYKVYTFMDKWTITRADKTTVTLNNRLPYGFTINSDVTVSPVFEETTRKYTVNFFNHDGTPIETASNQFDAGSKLKDILPNVIPYKVDTENELGEEEIFAFSGYAPSKTSTTVLSNEIEILSDYELYAIFKKVSIYDMYKYSKVEDFFTIYEGDGYIKVYSDASEVAHGASAPYLAEKVDDSYNISGCTITLKNKVSGKILIPSTFNSQPVIAIKLNDQNYGNDLEYVFFEKNNTNLRMYANSCFENMAQLKKVVNQPSKLRVIGDRAFGYCKALETCLFDGNIISIREGAFNQAFEYNGKTDFTIVLGSKLLYLGNSAFSNMDLPGMQFIIGEAGVSSALDLRYCGSPELIYNNNEIPSLTWFGSPYSDTSTMIDSVVTPTPNSLSSYFRISEIIFS